MKSGSPIAWETVSTIVISGLSKGVSCENDEHSHKVISLIIEIHTWRHTHAHIMYFVYKSNYW